MSQAEIQNKLDIIIDRLGWYNWNKDNYTEDMQFLSSQLMGVCDIIKDTTKEAFGSS